MFMLIRETLGDRVLRLRKQLKLSQRAVADIAEVSQGLIAQIERGTNQGTKHVVAIAKALRVSPDYLETGDDAQLSRPQVDANVFDLVRHRPPVPLISWVQAGEWTGVIDNFAPGDAEKWLPCPDGHGPHTFALRVRGVSMEPEFRDGTIIFVDPDKAADHLSYVVVRLENESEATFKQLVIEGQRRYLRPVNPDWPGPKIIEINGNATLCGVVIGEYRPR